MAYSYVLIMIMICFTTKPTVVKYCVGSNRSSRQFLHNFPLRFLNVKLYISLKINMLRLITVSSKHVYFHIYFIIFDQS